MKIRIKRIGPSSLAGILGAIYFLIGCVTSLLGLFGGTMGMDATVKSPFYTIGAASISPLVLLLNPLASGIGGMITGFILAWLYNFISRFTQGVVVETEETRYFF